MKKDSRIEALEWWSKKDFKARSINVIGGNRFNHIPVPDNLILCDSCNARIIKFPIPVYLEMALCPKCFGDLKKDLAQMDKKGEKHHGNRI